MEDEENAGGKSWICLLELEFEFGWTWEGDVDALSRTVSLDQGRDAGDETAKTLAD